MMLCSRCKKRPAVVFIARSDAQGSQNEGLCLTCARELGIKPVEDMLNKMGVTPEDMEQMQEQLGHMLSEATEGDAEENNEDSGDGAEFIPGGAATFPFLNSLFGDNNRRAEDGADGAAKPPKKKKRKFLDQYCTDLTRRAREGQIDRIIGRDREIYRVTQILSRRTKNNPCLIGEPGVGKTAIAEGLALRIAAGDVPPRLAEKEIHLLDLTALVAGTQFRGQFESRIKGLIDEVKAEGNIILFIDEVHNLAGDRRRRGQHVRRQYFKAGAVPRRDPGHRRHNVQ